MESRLEPPLAADEVTMLRSFLDFYRATVRRQCEGLTSEQLAQPLPPTSMTLGGMLKHLAFVEHWWFSSTLLGGPYGHERWADDFDNDPDWEWHSATNDAPAALFDWYDEAIAQSDRILDQALATGTLDQRAVRLRKGNPEPVTLRWILVHLIEEYARHAGHADLIRESIDGATDL